MWGADRKPGWTLPIRSSTWERQLPSPAQLEAGSVSSSSLTGVLLSTNGSDTCLRYSHWLLHCTCTRGEGTFPSQTIIIICYRHLSPSRRPSRLSQTGPSAMSSPRRMTEGKNPFTLGDETFETYYRLFGDISSSAQPPLVYTVAQASLTTTCPLSVIISPPSPSHRRVLHSCTTSLMQVALHTSPRVPKPTYRFLAHPPLHRRTGESTRISCIADHDSGYDSFWPCHSWGASTSPAAEFVCASMT